MHAVTSSDHLSSVQFFTVTSCSFAIILSSMPGIFDMCSFERSMLWAMAESQPPAGFFLQPTAARDSEARNMIEIFFMAGTLNRFAPNVNGTGKGCRNYVLDSSVRR